MRASSLCVAAALFAAAPCTDAQSAPRPGGPAFTTERAVTVDTAGWSRLALDATVLAGGAPFRVIGHGSSSAQAIGGLSDLRLYDTSGHEVPYLLAQPEVREGPRIPARAMAIPAKDSSTGFEVDLGTARRVDLLQVTGLPAPFLKRVRLEGSGDRARWTTLVAEGTLFDLPQQGLTQLELGFDAGDYRYLRLIWDDRASGRLPLPRDVLLRSVRTRDPLPPPLVTALTFERQASEPGKSRYVVRLPGTHLPVVALRLAVRDSNVLREARVTEARLTGTDLAPATLGSATLRRMSLVGITASSLDIPIDPPAESRLELTIDDGDNPPLDLSGISAVFAALPYLLFESRTAGMLQARYGAPSLAAPRYDLEALRDSADLIRARAARWGEVTVLATNEVAVAGAGMPAAGAAIDAARFRWSRTIRDTAPGLATLRLDDAALAHSRLVDLRIVSASGRQVPYLLEHLDGPLTDTLAAAERLATTDSLAGGGTASRYRLRLPYDSLVDAQLVLRTTSRVFRRHVRIEVPFEESSRRAGGMRTVAAADWAHAEPDTPAPALTLAIPPIGRDEAQLVVDEGDNDVLPLEAPILLLPGYELRFLGDGTAGSRLLYGRRDIEAPRYDIALLAPRLVGVPANEAALGPESAPTEGGASSMPGRIFWGALVLAVLVMLVIVTRLVKEAAPPAGR